MHIPRATFWHLTTGRKGGHLSQDWQEMVKEAYFCSRQGSSLCQTLKIKKHILCQFPHDTGQDVYEVRLSRTVSFKSPDYKHFLFAFAILTHFHVEWALSSVFVTEKCIWILHINKANIPKFSTGIFVSQRGLWGTYCSMELIHT